jgi:hypothetical protein
MILRKIATNGLERFSLTLSHGACDFGNFIRTEHSFTPRAPKKRAIR